MKKIKFLFLSIALVVSAKANSVVLEDFDFSVAGFNNASGVIAARWGTYSGGVFTQLLGNSYNALSNSGYVDFSGPELSVYLTQSDNTNVTAGTQLALALIDISENANYSVGAAKVVLVDTNWVVPTFVGTSTSVTYSFSASTSAVVGSFNYNGGNEQMALVSAVPEPATWAALAGLASLGFCCWRKRRSV